MASPKGSSSSSLLDVPPALPAGAVRRLQAQAGLGFNLDNDAAAAGSSSVDSSLSSSLAGPSNPRPEAIRQRHRRRASTPVMGDSARFRDVAGLGADSPERRSASPGFDGSDRGWSSGASVTDSSSDDERERFLMSAHHPDGRSRRHWDLWDLPDWGIDFDWQRKKQDAIEYLDLSFSRAYQEFRSRGQAKAEALAERARKAEDALITRARKAEDALYAAALRLSQKGKTLIRYEDLPTLWRNNEHILSGYRFIPSSDVGALLRSTFQLHNETLNIHTHLIGACIIVPLFWPHKGLDDQTTPMDRLVQTIYLIAALKCLLLSVSWHVMAGCADACLFERFACVDYTGIAWLVAASVWTLAYNGFYCQPNLALFYSLTTLVVGLVGAIVPWAKWFNERHNKGLRIAVFLSMCLTALAPITHAAFEHGPVKTANFFSPIVPSLLCYIGGLVIYALQWPERLAPGRFDIWGHGHQVWHLAIVGAIVLHYRAALIFHANRFDFSCAAAPPRPSFTSTLGSDPTPPHLLVVQSAAALIEAAGGFQGAAGLDKADSAVLAWRRALGKLGGGLVGRVWDRIVDWTQTW